MLNRHPYSPSCASPHHEGGTPQVMPQVMKEPPISQVCSSVVNSVTPSPCTSSNRATQSSLTAKHFDQGAGAYQEWANVQKQAAHRLLAWYQHAYAEHHFAAGLDLGAGPNVNFAALAKGCTHLTALDISGNMLAQCQHHVKIQADMDALALQANQFDLIFANFSMQWSQNISALACALHAIAKVSETDTVGDLPIKPSARAFISILVKGSLHELARAWHGLDNYTHVNQYHDAEHYIAQFKQAGWKVHQAQTHTFSDYFPDVKTALASVKAIGANTVQTSQQGCDKRRGLMTPRLYQQFCTQYQAQATEQGLPLSYHVLFLELHK